MSNTYDPHLEGKVVTPEGYVYDPLVLGEHYASDVINPNIPLEELQVNIHRGAAGFVNAKVMGPPPGLTKEEHEKLLETDDVDEYVAVSESGWKKNMILDCGLDKVAHMPWAQTFQFCVAGTTLDTTPVSASETNLKQHHSINSFWLTGEPHTSTLIQGNTIKLRRTFDFYKVFCPTVITEVGFKESPAARNLFSRILLDPPQQLHAGQFLRIEYLLQVVMSPWGNTLSAARYGNVFDNGGTHEIRDYAEGGPVVNNLSSYGIPASGFPTDITGVPQISGWNTSPDDLHALQLVGMAGIDPHDGVIKPIDKSGFCNEPFAPGTCSFGPGYGYCNRWRNGSAVTYHLNNGEGVTIHTSLPYVSDGVNSPYLNVGPLYDYVDEHWDTANQKYVPDPTTNAKVYRNPHEWLNYTMSLNNDGRTDKDGFNTTGALYFRTDGESDILVSDYNAELANDYRKYMYYNYWAPGVMENMGAHHGYQGNPSVTTVDGEHNFGGIDATSSDYYTQVNSYDPVYGEDQAINDSIYYWKTLYYESEQVSYSVFADLEHTAVPKTDARWVNGQNLTTHEVVGLAGDGDDPDDWNYKSVYQHSYGMTGKSSFENLTHLWDPIVKYDIGRGVNPTEIFVHYTNRKWDSNHNNYRDVCRHWDPTNTSTGGGIEGCCDKSHYQRLVKLNGSPTECDRQGAQSTINYTSGVQKFNHDIGGVHPWKGDPRLAWYHAHHKGFFDPALGIPSINKFQCGSARVYLSGMYMTFCPGTSIVTASAGNVMSVLPSNWNAATYVNNPSAFADKSYIPYQLGLSGELIPVPEPNVHADDITFPIGSSNTRVYGRWPDWNRDIPYKDDFVAGASCFLSTMSAPPTASFGTTTRWTSPSATEWDGYTNTNGQTISHASWGGQLFEGVNPEYHALVSQVSGTTLNRWDGSVGSYSTLANDAARGPYNDTVQTTGITAVELPLRLEPYTPGTNRRVKYAVFEPSIANLTWYSLGIGPTSKPIVNNAFGAMWEAATYPGYVYTFSGERDTSTGALTGNTKVDTHQLKLSFIYTWQRLTSYGQTP